MKKTFFLLCATLCLLSFGSCEDTAPDPSGYGEITNDTIGIEKDVFLTMYLEPNRYSLQSESITLIIENNTHFTLVYGTYYTMEYFNGREWEPFELKIMFTDIGLSIRPGTKKEEKISLFHNLHTYSAGKYRITKSFSPTNLFGDETGEDRNYELSAEFVLE
jgi:hypothetical protein